MKFLILLAFAGLATAAHLGREGLKWQPGHEYEYEYEGRLLTGLPELASEHFSGIGIRCRIRLQVQEYGRLLLQVHDAHYSRVNERLTPSTEDAEEQEGHNWRHLKLPSFEPVPSETARLLSEPSLFEVSEMSGRVKTITVSSDEPEWSINFKKALIVLFQTQTMESPIESRHTPSQWMTYEESIDGDCETSYELTELPESLSTVSEQVLPKPEYCPGHTEEESRVYELTKVRNLDHCRKRADYLSYKPAGISCSIGNCGGMWSRSSMTRYIVCGTPGGRFVIQSILNEGEINQNIMGFRAEKMLTGTRQVLKLVRKTPISSRMSGPTDSIVLTSLMYEYPPEMLHGSSSGGSDPSRHPHGIRVSHEHKRELIPKVEHLLREIITEDLFTLEGIPQKEISMKILTLSRTLTTFSRSELEKVYEDLAREFSKDSNKADVFKNVMFDILSMTGTTDSLKFVKHLIETGKLTKAQTVSFFFNLARVVRTPTRELLEELFELVTSVHIRERGTFVYNSAILSYSTLIQRACLADNRDLSYPTYIYGKFCGRDSPIVSERWIPYLQQELYRSTSVERKNVIVVALGLLSHEQVLPIVLPIIEEYSTPLHSHETSHVTRYLSVFALINVGRHHKERVLPVLSTIFANKGESTEIRIAAFNAMLTIKPDMTQLQKIATLTWTETDMEVLKVVNTAFYSLSEQVSMQDYKPSSALLVRHARLIYPLIKKTGGSYPSSGSVYGNEFLERLKVGYEGMKTWTGSKGFPLPAYFYTKLTYFLDELKYTPVEMGFHLDNMDTLMHEVIDVITKKPSNSISGEEEIKSELTREWNEVIDKLAIKTRESGKVSGALYFNFFEDSPIFASFKSMSSQFIREKIESLLRDPSALKDKLTGEKEFSFQRLLDLSPSEGIIPSDLGLPIIGGIHMPTVISVHGRIDTMLRSEESRVSANVRTFFDSRYTVWVGTICPFTGEFIRTGVDEHGVVDVPVNIEAVVNIPEGKVSMKLKPFTSSRHSESSPSSGIDFVYFGVTPYTARQTYFDLKPVLKSENLRVIKSSSERQERTKSVGEYLGLDVKVKLVTETPYLGVRFLLEKLYMYNYNVMNRIRFPTTTTAMTYSGLPSVRTHKVWLTYYPESSPTKEIDLVWKFGYATKEKNQPIMYHAIKEEEHGMFPYKIVSKPAGEHSMHPKRQEKTKEILERLGIEEEGKAVYVSFSGNLLGSRTHTWSYSMNLGTGMVGLKQKWDMTLSSELRHHVICVQGELEMPFHSIWKMRELRSERPVFKFRNKIGFGPSCSNSQVIVEGYTRTSEKQKELTEKSPEYKEYSRLVSKGVPLIQLSELAEKVRRGYSSLDEVDFKISYVQIPEYMMVVPKKALEVMKVWWMPYMTTENPFHHYSSSLLEPIREKGEYTMTSLIRTKINPESGTFNLSIKNEGPSVRPTEEYNFRDVRMPYPLPYVFPVSYVQGPMASMAKALTGKPLYPTCTLEGKMLSSFDNRTLMISEMDECFHLLSADCSKNKEYGVMIRKMESNPEGKKEIKVFLKKATIVLKPSEESYSESHSVKVIVDGNHIELSKSMEKIIKDVRGKHIAMVSMTKDGVVILKSRKISVIFDGEKVKLEGCSLLKNKLCGLCGDNNNQKIGDLKSPRMCIMSKPKLILASYRVSLSSKPCHTLPSHVEEELRKESEICIKPIHKHTKVVEGFEHHAGECTKTRHELVERSNELCFSKNPVVECSAACKPAGIKMKRVGFVCMEKSRAAEHVASKVREGQHVPSLRNLEESFSVERTMPARCIPVSSGSY